MKRNLSELEKGEFDLVVVGGGIYGACVAWEAVLRGLSVALLEKDDFCAATSANSLKTIHGGFRYLQNLDFARIRESIQERRTLSKIAPHLVHPLPVLIPTYGHGIKGRETMALALLANDWIGFDRNRLNDPQKRIPGGRTVSRAECLRLAPGLPEAGLTGGAIFYDAQVYNSERLVLAYVQSAARAGAQAANHARVAGLLVRDGRVVGVRAVDGLSGAPFEVRGRLVVNTAGPWIDQVRGNPVAGNPVAGDYKGGQSALSLAKAINVIVSRQLFQEYAVGLPGDTRYLDTASASRRKNSFLFAAPWRSRSILGTIYAPFEGHPDGFRASERDVRVVLEAFNEAYPAGGLRREEVSFVHAGLLPMAAGQAGEGQAQDGSVRLMKHYRIDGSPESGFLSVVGVKYTTARDVAQRVVSQACARLGRGVPASSSASRPLAGGEIERFGEFLQEVLVRRPCDLEQEDLRSLVTNYGSAYPEVLRRFQTAAGGSLARDSRQALLQAQVLYSIDEEMAHTLSDVVFRRTELGTAAHPGQETLEFCAQVMAERLGWSQAGLRREVDEVNRAYTLEAE